MQYTIRTASSGDLKILDRIHTQNMKDYVERIYSWNASLFRDCFVPQEYKVIEIQQQIVGFFKVVTSSNEIYLAEIQILKEYQNKGIGTNFIQSIIERAKNSDRKLWLKVIRNNPAEQLYQRLGFIVFEESSTHKKMAIP